LGIEEPLAMDLAHKRWTLSEWTRLSESGILGSDPRLLLLEGEIFQMCPQGSLHATALSLTQELLRASLSPGTYLRVQLPLYLGASSDPEPDLAVVVGQPRDYKDEHPKTALLVVEISDSSLAFDLGRKAQIYARQQLPEYWVIDLEGRTLRRFRSPHELGYGSAERLTQADHLVWNGRKILVADLLP
jgi:Uma2 family endonuclease